MILAHWHNLLRQTQIPAETGITFVKAEGMNTTDGSSHTVSGLASGDIVICLQAADTAVANEPALYTGFTNIKYFTVAELSVPCRWSYIISSGSSISFTGTDRDWETNNYIA